MDKPFGMDRSIQSKILRNAIKDVQKILSRYDLAGYVMLIDKEESAWSFGLVTSWNALYNEPRSDFGFKLRAAPSTVPEDEEKLRLAAHTFVNLLRAGEMTAHMAASFIKVMEDNGMEVQFERDKMPNITIEPPSV